MIRSGHSSRRASGARRVARGPPIAAQPIRHPCRSPRSRPAGAASPSIWKGLYVGSDVFSSAGSQRLERRSSAASAFVGYDRHFDNNLVLGIQASTGFAPFSIQHSPFKGYDYGEVSAKVGYEMGRVTPYLTTGIVLARPNGTPGAGYLSPTDSANNLFNNSRIESRRQRHYRRRLRLCAHRQIDRRRRGRRGGPGEVCRAAVRRGRARPTQHCPFVPGRDSSRSLLSIDRTPCRTSIVARCLSELSPPPARSRRRWPSRAPSRPSRAPSFGYDDVVKRARDLAGAPFDAQIPALPDSLAHLDFDAWRDIRFKSDKLLAGGGRSVPARIVPSRPSLQTAGDGQYPARRADLAGALCGQSLRLRTQQDRRRAADQSRLCRLSPALSAERAACDGRGDRFSRRQLFPVSRPRPALRTFRARPRDRGRRPGGISVLSRILDRIAGARRRARDRLRPARRRIGDRRLPLRNLSRHGHQRRSDGDACSPARRFRRSAWRRCRRCSWPARTTIASTTTSAPNCTIRTGC